MEILQPDIYIPLTDSLYCRIFIPITDFWMKNIKKTISF